MKRESLFWRQLPDVGGWKFDEKIALAFIVVPIASVAIFWSGEQIVSAVNAVAALHGTDANVAVAEAARMQVILGWASLVVAMVAALFAYRAMAVNRTTARTQLRAYIQADTNGVNWGAPVVAGSVKLVNTGETPARDVSVSLGVSVRPLPATADQVAELFSVLSPNEAHRTSLGKGLQLRPTIEVPFERFGPFATAEMVEEAKALIVFGLVTYKDVFDRTFTTRFLHYYRYQRFSPEQGIVYHFGNEAS